MSVNICIRPARPQDATLTAPLIYSTGPQSFDLAFGSRDRAIGVIARLFTADATLTSYRNSTVAELDGFLAGILVLLDTGINQATQLGTAKELLKIVGPLFIFFRLPIFFRQSAATLGPQPGELFIGDIAVAPDMQGSGIGRMLMEAAEKKARKDGYTALSLNVSANNSQAIGFYRRLGYSCSASSFDPWLKWRYGLPGVLRMVKPTRVAHG